LGIGRERKGRDGKREGGMGKEREGKKEGAKRGDRVEKKGEGGPELDICPGGPEFL